MSQSEFEFVTRNQSESERVRMSHSEFGLAVRLSQCEPGESEQVYPSHEVRGLTNSPFCACLRPTFGGR